MKIKQIIEYLESIAPLEYQESYDNSGLLIGDKHLTLTSALITLDCTEEVLEEAIINKCNLIITHHPIIFHPIKKLNGSNYTERVIIKAIKNDIAIYAIHTNLDNIINGVNGQIADKLKLENRQVLLPKSDLLRQLVVYCPTDHADVLRKTLFNAGAGAIGNYKNCSFSLIGKGTFKAMRNANPYSGDIEQDHVENEERIEVVYFKDNEKSILDAMIKCHPYEEVAHQIYAITNTYKSIGSGIIGELKEEMNSNDFLDSVKRIMKVNTIRHTSLIKNHVKTIALCGGSGSFCLDVAKRIGADIFISSDFKYHEFFNADNQIIIADIGHYESEQYTKELIYNFLIEKFTKFAGRISKINTNPIKYL